MQPAPSTTPINTIGDLATLVTGGFNDVFERFGAMENHMEGLENRMERIEGRMENLEHEMQALKSNVNNYIELQEDDTLSLNNVTPF